MTVEEAKERLKDIQMNNDAESAHKEADAVLCQFLIELGYRDVVYEYRLVYKWYS